MIIYTPGTVLALSLIIAAAQGQKCGQRKVSAQKLIFNGLKSLDGAWPWHGALFHRKHTDMEYACGVSILTEQFVITAAHCTIDQQERQRLPARRVFIKVGVTNLNTPGRNVQQHEVDRIIRHEEYDEATFEDDIALIQLYTDITYSDYVQPICLWQGDTSLEKVVSQIGYVVGWGYTEQRYGPSQILNEATMPIVSRKDCIQSDPNHYSKFYIQPKTFCAGYRNGTTAALGDSGGGLFLRVGNTWVLRGIVSSTKIDPITFKIDTKSYVLFTDVSNYVNWIKRNVIITTSYTAGAKPAQPISVAPQVTALNYIEQRSGVLLRPEKG